MTENMYSAGSSAFELPAFITTKPQAMLVNEYSTSVDTVKKEPPFAKMEVGNANRTTSKRRFIHIDEKSLSHTCWNCKYHIVLCAKVPQKGDIQETKKGYWQNP